VARTEVTTRGKRDKFGAESVGGVSEGSGGTEGARIAWLVRHVMICVTCTAALGRNC